MKHARTLTLVALALAARASVAQAQVDPPSTGAPVAAPVAAPVVAADAPPPAPLPRGRFEAGIGTTMLWHTDPRWDALRAPRVMAGGDLHFGFNVWGHAQRLTLAAEVGYRNQSFTDATIGGMATEGHIHAPYAGLSLRFSPLFWLQPFARVTASPTYTELWVSPAQERALGGSSWAFHATAGLGLQISTGPLSDDRRYSRFEITGGFEGGVLVGTESAYTLRPEAYPSDEDETTRVAERAVNLGTVAPHAGYFRLWLGMRF